MAYSLQNRRYIGNKFKLLHFIDSVIEEEHLEFSCFADLFAGTGVVAEHLLSQGKVGIINDNLYSNYVFYQAWLSNGKFDQNKIEKILSYYNQATDFISDNYFSDNFSGTYYSYEDAKQIGSIREHLETMREDLTVREYYIILASLLYTADKIANTVGHFEAFLAHAPVTRGVKLQILNLNRYKATPKIYNEDANILATKVSADLVYLDPPYNARQYANFYHLLENLAEWKKLPVAGKTLKMPRKNKMSKYSTANATATLEQLVNSLQTRYVLLSYNNTYTANSGASINKIAEEDILYMLKKVGTVKRFDTSYRFFNSGKTDFKNHRELLYLCKLK